jgi:hypothetical protein
MAMAKVVLPRVQAMVLCDGVEESDRESDVYHLRGVRSMISTTAFPYTCPRLCVFLQMSGHVGEASCHIEIDRPEMDQLVYRSGPRVITFEGPLSIMPVLFRLRNCRFPAPGLSYVHMYHGSKLIGERPLHVVAEA